MSNVSDGLLNVCKNIPEINFAKNFMNGMPTSTLATATNVVGSTIERAEAIYDDTVSAAKNLVRDVSTNTVSFLGNTTGSVAGTLMGTVASAEQILHTTEDIAKVFVDDMTAYTVEVGTYLLDWGTNFALSFPVEITQASAKKFAELSKDKLSVLMSQLLVNAEVIAELKETESLQDMLTEASTIINGGIGKLTGLATYYVNYGMSFVQQASYWMAFGQEFVAYNVADFEDEIKKYIGLYVTSYLSTFDDWRKAKTKVWGDAAGEAMFYALWKVSQKPVLTAIKSVNIVTQKVIIKAKALVVEALLKIKGLIGG